MSAMATFRLLAFVATIALAADVNAQPAPQFGEVRDGLYLARHGEQTSLIFAAPEGILIADPFGLSGARWLRDEVASRFPGRPVRYVLYTSSLFERNAGVVEFPAATVVAHSRLNGAIVTAAQSLPATIATLDRNGDERIAPTEWAGSDIATRVPGIDANKDGVLTSREVFRIVRLARTTFRDRITLSIGTAPIEVFNPRGDRSAPALFFPRQRAVYLSTTRPFNPQGFSFGGANPRDVMVWLRALATLPFDTIITGRGETLTRSAFDEVVRFAEDVFSTSVEAYTRGATVQRAAASPNLQRYAGTSLDTRRVTIEAIFRSLRVTRTELQAAGLARWMQPNPLYCEAYDTCVSGGEIAGASGGLRLAMSRTGFIIEAAIDDQFAAERQGFFDDEAYAQRLSRGSLLFRYGSNRPTSRSIELLAGPTVLLADTRGLTRVKQAVAPIGGRHPIAERKIAVAATAGANFVLPLASAISVVVPIRATVVPNELTVRWPGRVDVSGGLGLSVRLTQRVR